jgi:hypothetical protein
MKEYLKDYLHNTKEIRVLKGISQEDAGQYESIALTGIVLMYSGFYGGKSYL